MTDETEDDGFVTVHVSPYHAAQGTRAEVAAMLGRQARPAPDADLIERLRLWNWDDAADRIEALLREHADAEAELRSELARLDALIDDLRACIRAGAEMRDAQRRYFRNRTQTNLIASKTAEAAFDRLAPTLLEVQA